MRLRFYPGVLLAALLLLGTCLFRDYGVHWDEYHNRNFGQRTIQLVATMFREGRVLEAPARRQHDWTHGPAFELLLQGAEHASGLTDSRDVILLRHYATFLAYCLGVVAFWFLCRHVFGERGWAVLGCVLLVAHPRIFAHAFYNSVDIPFLVFFTWSLYSLLRLLEGPGPRTALAHAAICGVLVGTRLIGATVPALTVLAGVTDMLVQRRDRTRVRALGRALALFIPVCLAAIGLLWPLLWSNPVENLLRALVRSSRIASHGSSADLAAWLETPSAIFFTTPLHTLFLVAVGTVVVGLLILRPTKAGASSARRTALVLAVALVLPLVVPPLMGTRLQDGWRHHFFVYPLLVVFAVYGARALWEAAGGLAPAARAHWLRAAGVLLLVGSLGVTATFMVRHHPFQFVYGNALSGPGFRLAHWDCTLDEWGVSYRAALEHILENDSRSEIRVWFANRPGINSPRILPLELRRRLVVVDDERQADYLLSNLRSSCSGEEMSGSEWYALSVESSKFMVVRKP